jgi:hypothetical protein
MRGRATDTRAARVSRRSQLLVLAAFTPYLGTALSVRVEHVIVYGLLLFIATDPKRLEFAAWQARRLLVPWLLVAGLVVGNILIQLTATGSLRDFRTLERLLRLSDSFLLQTAAVLVVLATMSRRPEGSERQIRLAAATFVTLMCANAVLIITFEPASIENILRQFWTNPAGTTDSRGFVSVAARELTAGRYGGIFNQPFDGGLAYSLALVTWWYLSQRRFERSIVSTTLPLIGLGLILIGGLSTGSKVFLAAMLIAVSQVVLMRTGEVGKSIPRNLRLAATAAAGTAAVIWIELADFRRFWTFVGALGSDTGAVTGGRFRSFGQWVDQIRNDLSLLGSQNFFTDDAFRAYLTGSGIVGLVLITLVYREFFGIGGRLPRRSPERWLAFGLTSVTLAASFGSVSLHTIRASSVFWILMALLLGHAENLRRSRVKTTAHGLEGLRNGRRVPTYYASPRGPTIER